MNELIARNMARAYSNFLAGGGVTCTINWVSNSGTWDAVRREYTGVDTDTVHSDEVNCVIKELGPAQIRWGNYGSAEVGDLIIGIDTDFDLDGKIILSVIIDSKEYRVIPNSDIFYTGISGIVSDVRCSQVLHCRYVGDYSG